MSPRKKTGLQVTSPYNATITREGFLFFEMRIVAKLMIEGLSYPEIEKKVTSENSFQYPTERKINRIAIVCYRRLNLLNSEILVKAIAEEPSSISKQICLYAMMKQYPLVRDFMVTVIGNKYKNQDFSYGNIDINGFFTQLQEQDDWVSTWTESTISHLKRAINHALMENGYLDGAKATHLNPVLINSLLENAIRLNNDEYMLPAFNCFF